jgi:predicted ABC-type ATPase
MEGGHIVPIDKIVTRHTRALANLTSVATVAQRVYVFDNSLEDVEARLCARTVEGALRKVYGALPQWVDAALGDLPRHQEFVDLRVA